MTQAFQQAQRDHSNAPQSESQIQSSSYNNTAMQSPIIQNHAYNAGNTSNNAQSGK